MRSRIGSPSWSDACFRVAAVLALVLVASPVCEARQRIVFTWDRSMRISAWELDLENQRVTLTLPEGGTVTVPLSIVRRILGSDEEVAMDLDLDAVPRDPDEPDGTVPWMPATGWSGPERWDAWEDAPRWEFRWTDAEAATALVPGADAGATHVELRLLSIAYAERVLGGVTEPETQSVDVELEGTPLGTIRLGNEGWETYRLRLPANLPPGPLSLRLATSRRAQPSTFAEDGGDRRTLGVALDYVRFCDCPR